VKVMLRPGPGPAETGTCTASGPSRPEPHQRTAGRSRFSYSPIAHPTTQLPAPRPKPPPPPQPYQASQELSAGHSDCACLFSQPFQLPAHPVGRGVIGPWLGARPNQFQLFALAVMNGMDGQPVHPTPRASSLRCRSPASDRPANAAGITRRSGGCAVHHRVEFLRWFTPRRAAGRLAAGNPVRGNGRRRRTGGQHHCATMLRTARCCESPCRHNRSARSSRR